MHGMWGGRMTSCVVVYKMHFGVCQTRMSQSIITGRKCWNNFLSACVHTMTSLST